jgi:EAL domain-containing protein (putative c-di-GMP-specific phosphodiesterase class I)
MCMGKPLSKAEEGLEAAHQFALTGRLKRAIEKEEFMLFYQPQVDLGTGKIAGMEALLRWEVSDLGMMPPSEFIPVAEESGLIVPLGEWVLKTACAQNKQWQNAQLPRIPVAVNLSGRQFHHQDLVEKVAAALENAHLEPEWLDLEITETYAMQDADFTLAILKELKSMGVHISLDDFGTGYSSLSHLKHFPIDTLKIDRSFVKDLATDPKEESIISAVIILAHSLGMDVVAEGVETAAELSILRKHHCDKMQGFYFSRPVPVKDFETLLRSGKTL